MTAAEASRGRGRPRDPRTDEAILRAALELFTEHGHAGTSIEAIARRAGVGKLTVYRRWESKDELIAAAVESARGQIPSPGTADLDGMSYAEISQVIVDALPVSARTLAEPGYRAMLAQVFGSSVTHPGLMAAFWQNHILPRRRTAHLALSRAVEEGVLPPETDIEALIDMTVGAVVYRLLRPEPPDTDELLEYLRTVYGQAGMIPRQ
ncbi:TetR/AcrR family transcriptional regulator [Promicromonospora iranensis]|uniref:TetR/AcrR family transcriptional regulator n=1 Tax=Promicromonospora iranensis TaxID=1105144 RepID=UPI0023A9877B|nr:TetR/AcrR family transcriptional regulator [Promicromonospora iranensis]